MTGQEFYRLPWIKKVNVLTKAVIPHLNSQGKPYKTLYFGIRSFFYYKVEPQELQVLYDLVAVLPDHYQLRDLSELFVLAKRHQQDVKYQAESAKISQVTLPQYADLTVDDIM